MNQVRTGGLSGIEETAFITLHARALDAGVERPILADPYAIEVAGRVDYDFSRLQPTEKLDLRERLNVAIRAVQFDAWVTEFVGRHRSAVVLDLGCGLDSRAFRVKPPEGTDWYDVDTPAMIALRRRLYPEVDGVHPLATALESPDWLENLPAQRPVIAIADGLYPFMTRDTFRALITRLTDHFTGGELLLLGFSRLSSRMMTKVVPAMRTLGVTINEGFDDPREPERWNPALRLVTQRRLIDSPAVELMPPGMRRQSKIMRSFPPLARMDKGMLRFRFGCPGPP